MNRKHCNLLPGNQKVVTDLYNAYWVKGSLVISGQQKSIQVIRRCLTYTKNQNPTLYCVIYKCPGHLSHRLMVTDWQRNLDDYQVKIIMLSVKQKMVNAQQKSPWPSTWKLIRVIHWYRPSCLWGLMTTR